MSAKREVLAKDAASASVRAGACLSRHEHHRNVSARQHPLPARLTRREFVKIGGALFVSLSLPTKFSAHANASSSETSAASPDATQLASWLEIRSDNSIIARTGRTDTGTGMSAYYAQAIAEELNVRPESISLITGDTDKTPDGGYSAGFLTGMSNLRKVSAYTYQALLALAATRLGVPISALSVVNGAVSGGRKSITYGELVAGQQLDLKIHVSGSLAKPDPSQWVGVTTLDGLTVTGDPPAKPIAQYQVIGTSYHMPAVRDKVI